MSWLDRLRNQSRDDELSHDIDRELAFHLAEREDELIAQGMDPEQARHEARRRFGNVGRKKEETRERNLFGWLDTLVADLRYAVRSLRLAPAFAFVAILSLGLGIGANTAIFSILNALMLKTLPVDRPEELVMIDRDGGNALTNPLWEAIRDRQDVLASAFAFGGSQMSLTNGGEARYVITNWVSGDFFSTLGIRPTMGRVLAHADDYRGCPAVAVLDYGFWQQEYGGAANVIEKAINFNGHPFAVVGVADPRFAGVMVGLQPQAYIPLCTREITDGVGSLDGRSNWFLRVVGRPKPGVSAQQIDARLATLAPSIAEATMPPKWPPKLQKQYLAAQYTLESGATGFSGLRGMYKTALYDLMAIVALVLIVACANVANLLLARATVRRREVAVRLALGASRGRIARQLITESLLLSTCGAFVGALMATWGSRLLVALIRQSPQTMLLDLSPDARMLGFTIAIAMLTGVIFGIAPAWQASHVDPQTALKAQGRGLSQGLSQGLSRLRMGRALVVSQIAISLVLIAAAGLLVGSWRRLATVDPGFRRDQVLIVSANLHDAAFTKETQQTAIGEILTHMRALPGVHSAASAAVVPIGGGTWNGSVKVEGSDVKTLEEMSWMNAVSDGYFATMGIPLRGGRDFDRGDTPTSQKVAIVSESMARKFFGTTNVIGRRLQTETGSNYGDSRVIIGVVGSTKGESLRDSNATFVYLPRGESAMGEQVKFVLHADAPLSIAPAVKDVIAQTSPRISLELTTIDRRLDDSLRLMRAIAAVAGLFGALALILAMIGLYGIMSYGVARRRSEIGVRIALGAGRSRIVRMVLGDVGIIIAIGVVLGVALSSAATRLVASFIYDVSRNDPANLVGSAVTLGVVGLLAAAIPAWRASCLDPVAALRED
ncbi:MAG TPA: ABC transporter permease [Gemmatimonadaceae bacterium]|jgi:predicted permease